MKRLLLLALAIGLTFGVSADTTMQIRNGVLTTNMNGNNFKITDLAAPTNPGDAATKGYADSHGGGPGNGTTLSSLVLFVPTDLFANVTFDTSSSDVTGTLTKSAAPVTSFYGNPSTGTTTPIFMNAGQARTALSIQNVDNTSDANKPVSGPTLTAISSALAAFAGTANITTLGTITTGTWQGSVIGNTYLPTLDSIRAPAADLSIASKKIINLAAPVSGTDATNKTYVDGAISTGVSGFTGSSSIVTVGTIGAGTWQGSPITSAYLPTLDAIAAPVANVSLSNKKITNLADPSSSLDATNKQYVDSVATAGPPHPAVNLATTANIASLSTEQTIDGTLTSASRVLVKNQTTGSANGIYVTGAGSWTRATDADANAEMSGLVFVTGGTANLNTQWGLTTPQPITLGTTSLTYSLTASGGTIYTAGNGLTLTGNQFSALGTTNKISVGGGTIDIASTYIGQTSITTLGTITSGTWNGSLIAGQYGGTGVANTGKTLTLSSATPSVGGTNTGDVTLTPGPTGENYLSISGQVITANPVDLSGTNVTGTLAPARFPTGIVGDVTVANVSGTLTSTIGANKVTNSQLALAPFSTIKGNAAVSGTSATTDMSIGTTKTLLSLNNVENTALSTWGGSTSITTLGTIATGTIPTANLSGTIATGQIANNAVTYAKMQTVAPARLLGNPSPTTSATPSEIPLGAGLAFSGGAIVPSSIPAQIGGDANATWGSPNFTYAFVENTQLNANRTRTLPLTSGYKDGDLIYYLDPVTHSLNGAVFVPQGSTDTLKGLNATAWGTANPLGGYQPFTAAANNNLTKSITFTKRGADWRVYSLGGEMLFTTAISNPANLTGVATFDVGSLTLQPSIYVPNQNSTLVVPTDSFSTPGVLTDISITGAVAKRQLNPADIIPVENNPAIGTAGSPFVGTTYTVTPADGTVDTVRIAGTLTAPVGGGPALTMIWPPAGQYQAGQTVALIDASGSVGPSTAVSVTPTSGDTLANTSQPFIFSDPNGRKDFTSDGANNWTVSQTKVVIPPYSNLIQGANATFTMTPNTGAVKQNALLFLTSGPNNLLIPAPFDGMDIDLVLIQPTGGTPGTLGLPQGSRVGATGAGVITLTSTNPAVGSVDFIHGRYVGGGNLSAFLWDRPVLDYTTAVAPSAVSALNDAGSPTSARLNLSWSDVANETSYELNRALASGGGYSPVSGSPLTAGSTGYSDSNLQPNIAYKYEIRACNSGGCSAFVFSPTMTTLPGGPTADALEWHFNDAVTLGTNTQSVGSTITGGPTGTARIPGSLGSLVSTGNYAFAPLLGMPTTTGVTFTQHGLLTGGTQYQYHVVAYNAAGRHNGHNVALLTTGPLPADFGTTNYQTVNWTQVTGATYYEVYRTLGGSSQGKLTNTGLGFAGNCTAGTCSLDDTAVAASGTYSSTLSNSNDIYDVTSTVVPYTGNQIISVSFWIKTNAFPTGSAAVDIVSGSASTFRIQGTASKLQVTFPGTGTPATTLTAQTTATPINDNNWHNVIVILNNSQVGNTIPVSPTSSDTIRVYFDGGLPLTAGNLTQRTLTYPTSSRVGPKAFTDAAAVVGSGSFTGFIDDVRIYRKALTTTPSTGDIALINSGGQQ